MKCAKALLVSNDCEIKVTKKNKDFDREFSMKDAQKKDILKSLEVEDCISIGENNNPNYADSEVYIFIKKITLQIYGEPKKIELYIKMYIKEFDYYDKVIVISFHKEGVFE